MHRGMDRILVLEDDVVFVDHLPEKMQQHIRELPKEWDQWYPGGQNLGKKVSRVSKHLVRSDNVNRTHAYAVQGEGLRKVFRWCLDMQQWKSPYHIDHHFGRLQKDSSFVALLSSPRLMGQREGISDIGRKMWKINMWDFKDETSLLISEPVRVDMEPYKPPSMKNPVPLPQVVRATAGGRMGRSYFMMPGGAHR